MVQDFTLHTHTLGFDGKNTIQEMAKTAEDNGMEFIGISNHFIVHPQIKNTRFYGFSVSGGYSNIYHDNSDEIYNEFIMGMHATFFKYHSSSFLIFIIHINFSSKERHVNLYI